MGTQLNVTVEAAALREALADGVIGKVAEARMVLLRADELYGEAVVYVIGRDELMQSTRVVPAQAESGFLMGEVLANADKLKAAVIGIDGPVSLTAEDQLLVRSGRRRFVVPTLPPDTFALFDEDKQAAVEVDAVRLRQGMERVLYAAEVADTARGLFGVCVHSEGVAATNGTQLAFDDFYIGMPNGAAIVIPTPAAARVTKALEPGATVSVMHGESGPVALEVELAGSRLVTRLQNREFPSSWRRIVPAMNAAPFTVKMSEAEAAGPLNRVSAFLDGKTKMANMKLMADGEIGISNELGGELDDTMPAEVTGDLDERIPVPQLLQVLAMAGKAEVTWYGGDSAKSRNHMFVIDGRSDRHVMSPVKR